MRRESDSNVVGVVAGRGGKESGCGRGWKAPHQLRALSFFACIPFRLLCLRLSVQEQYLFGLSLPCRVIAVFLNPYTLLGIWRRRHEQS